MKSHFLAIFVAGIAAALWLTACDVPIEAPHGAGPGDRELLPVTFEANGGEPAPEEQNVVEGDLISEPLPPKKSGFVFGGWYSDDEFAAKWDFENNIVTETITLFAKWTVVEVVTFVANDGAPEPEPQMVPVGGLVTQPEPVAKTGFGFAGWFLDEYFTEKWDFSTDTIDGAIVLYAKWDSNYYVVTFDTVDTAIPVPEAQNIAFNANAMAPSLPITTGYKLDGWYTDEAATDLWDFNTNLVTEDITLYLKLAPITYSIIFDANIVQGVEGNMPPLQLVYDSEHDLPANGFFDTRHFYDMLSWNTQADGGGVSYNVEETVFNLTDVDEGEITLYAQWDENMSDAIMQAYIISQNVDGLGDQNNTPIPIALFVELSGTNWTLINNALNNAGKYVNLDLSGCVPSTAESGPGLSSSGVFTGIRHRGMEKIAGLTMPDTVLEIAANALSIEHRFSADKMITLNLPNVRTIGNHAFAYCGSLTNLSLPQALTLNYKAFYSCGSLTDLLLPNVITIGSEAFMSSGLRTVEFPNATIIYDKAFNNCRNLISATFPEVITICNEVFYWCVNLTEIFFPMVEVLGNLAFGGAKIQQANFPNAHTLATNALYSCSNLLSVNIPNVNSLGTRALIFCIVLNSITLGPTPPTLGSEVLKDAGNTGNITVHIPEGSEDAYSDPEWLANFFASSRAAFSFVTYAP
jgi:uncharacterized repeat protein (TIGR02543 family)